MNEEPTTTPIPEEDNTPAAKGDLANLERETNIKFDAVLQMIKDEGHKTRRHFDTVAENIHQDVSEANQDEIDLLNNQVPDHEDRIVDLEEHAGLSVGPRFEHIK